MKTDSRKDSAGEKVSPQSGRQKSCGGKTTTAEGVYFTSPSTAFDKHSVTTIRNMICTIERKKTFCLIQHMYQKCCEAIFFRHPICSSTKFTQQKAQGWAQFFVCFLGLQYTEIQSES